MLSAFTSRESINRTTFGVTAIALTFAWLGGEIASFMKLRIHLPLPETNPKNKVVADKGVGTWQHVMKMLGGQSSVIYSPDYFSGAELAGL